MKAIEMPTLQGIPSNFMKLKAARQATLMPPSELKRSTTPTDEGDDSEEAVIELLKGMHH